jgi:hypothetical protein
MAKVKRKGMLFGLSGKLGDFVFSQMPDGSTRISVKPEHRRSKATKGQKDNRNRFRDATRYARAAAKDYPIYAELAKERPMITAYNIALSDLYHPPVIHSVERNDGVIRVQASDDVMVADVHVWIFDANGKRLEDGKAIQVDSEWWEYASTTEGAVEVVVHDLPWNEAKKTL